MGIYGNKNNKNMFFVSTSNMNGKTLSPRIPDNYLTKNGYEDDNTKRVCFAPSIDKCLMGLSENLSNKEFYVHKPIPNQKLDIKKPNIKEVPDSKITGEIWVLNNVKIECVGRIKVIKDKGLDGHKFKYGDKEAELYDWEWEWMENNKKQKVLTNEEYEFIITESTDKPGRNYKCPYCDKRMPRKDLVYHIDEDHEELIPENFTAARIVFNYINKKQTGHCVQCGKETKWNEDAWRYDRFCCQKCTDEYSKIAKERMMKVYGKKHLLGDEDQQRKMLANRSISGKYKFSDGTYKTYCGSYEKKLLEFFDKGLQTQSKDIMSPGPTIEYEYNGEKHFWITDQYYVPANLVFDVKDGGDNPNTRTMPEYRAKQDAKEKAIKDQKQYNYIRLTDNNFTQLLLILAEIKERLMDDNQEPVVHINEYMAMAGANPPVGIEQDEGSYVVPCMMNNTFVDSAYCTDKYMSNSYRIKDGRIKKTSKKELEETYQLGNMYKYIGADEKEKREKFIKEYKEESEVSQDYFYIELSNKIMLSKDQIMFDESFVETINGFKEGEERCNIIEASMTHQFNKSTDSNIYFPITNESAIMESNKILKEYPNLNIEQDINGYFVINPITECRSISYSNISEIEPYVYSLIENLKI